MSISKKQEEFVSNFSLFDDWMSKYSYIIDLGKELTPLASEHKIEANEVKGCQSKVWIHHEKKGEKLYFFGDSDAILVKGIISMLIHVFSGESAKGIASSTLFFIEKIGLKEHLSMTRSNGLLSMIEYIQTIAKKKGA